MQRSSRVFSLAAKIGMFSLAVLAQSNTVSAAADSGKGYIAHQSVAPYIDSLVAEHKMDRGDLERWFSEAEKKQSILDAISRPAEKTKPWKDYRKIFLTQSRIEKGVEFWLENAEALARAEETYGVPAEMIVSIIGVETRYGSNVGRYRVIDALSTLAFDYPKRSKFFKKELTHFLLLTQEQKQDPLSLLGSYAGAMGYGQFMPSSYRAYAVDFDGDAKVDIWKNPTDAIGSVANYFKRHGWKSGQPVITRARVDADYDREAVKAPLKPSISLGDLKSKGLLAVESYPDTSMASPFKLEGSRGAEFWLGLQNFYVITRYNHSRMYALSVYQLSLAIGERYRSDQAQR